MELWDMYDKERNKTNKTIQRGQKLKDGEYHLAVQVCIFNSKGEMLIQQRQPFKDDWSNMWDITTAGSAIAGENAQKAAERELYEELGLKIDLENIRPKLTVNFGDGFCDIFLVEKDIDLNSLTLQYDEVKAVKWADKNEITEMIKNGEFITYFESFIAILFDLRNSKDSHSSEKLK